MFRFFPCSRIGWDPSYPFFAVKGGQTNGWTDEQMDGCTDSPCILQDIVLFEAAALLTCKTNDKD